MNKLDQLYAEFGSNICLFPFLSGFYSKATGTSLVMPCSMTKPIDWRIRNNSIISTVNNDTWIDLRKNFIHGSCHTTEYCGTCSYAEKNGGTSARKLANQFLLDKISIDPVEEVRRIIDNDYIVDRLYTLDYCPSNYCNYECIMCFGPASSTRNTFEIKMLGQGMTEKYDHTTVTSDFNISQLNKDKLRTHDASIFFRDHLGINYNMLNLHKAQYFRPPWCNCLSCNIQVFHIQAVIS